MYAVRGLYLALRRSECFGLLGINGAGKTNHLRDAGRLVARDVRGGLHGVRKAQRKKTKARNTELIVDTQTCERWRTVCPFADASGGEPFVALN
ncbi:hypothetical protein HPB48_000923 [Haemaphysalis longicornis]|uniref:Uncharacterized protein n=1 Tax=Haemaphysalis longicornis TaxID=44386 RepID=A0A9J6FAP2_HAELO|nr:hypothetical protein HPB48_000923 [Haemaphysalis longicornis]